MSRSGDIDVGVNDALWTIGWNAKRILVAVAVISLFMLVTEYPGWIAGAGFAGGTAITVIGLIYVWMNLKTVHDAGIETVEDAVEAHVELRGEDIGRFSFLNNSEFGVLLPPRNIYVTTLLVDDDRLIVHDGAVVELAKPGWRAEGELIEYPYDQITSLDYESAEELTRLGTLAVTLSGEDGDSDVYQFARGPDEAIEAVRSRLQASRDS